MHGIAAKIAQKIRVLFQYQGLYAGAPQQIAEHHAGRTTADDAALNTKRFGHGVSNHTRSSFGQPGMPVFCRIAGGASWFSMAAHRRWRPGLRQCPKPWVERSHRLFAARASQGSTPLGFLPSRHLASVL